MRNVLSVEFYPGTREERLPGFTPQFPHLASRSVPELYPAGGAPWHWHRSLELFYVQQGAVVYHTPHSQQMFRAGMGGMVNSNVLHHTQTRAGQDESVLLLHLFEPELVAGVPGGTVETKYITPLLNAPGLELLALDPADPAQAETLRLLWESLTLDEAAFGYELRLQAMLCAIWLRLVDQVRPPANAPAAPNAASEKVKQMMAYIRTHAAEKLTVAAIASAAYCSQRECYRVFQECLHTTPTAYLQNIRLQAACKMLIETDASMTEIAQRCGLGSSSYFGAQFRAAMGCPPSTYREKWQDIESARQE